MNDAINKISRSEYSFLVGNVLKKVKDSKTKIEFLSTLPKNLIEDFVINTLFPYLKQNPDKIGYFIKIMPKTMKFYTRGKPTQIETTGKRRLKKVFLKLPPDSYKEIFKFMGKPSELVKFGFVSKFWRTLAYDTNWIWKNITWSTYLIIEYRKQNADIENKIKRGEEKYSMILPYANHKVYRINDSEYKKRISTTLYEHTMLYPNLIELIFNRDENVWNWYQNLEDTQDLKGLDHLQTLAISGCGIRKIQNLGSMTNLISLNISDNPGITFEPEEKNFIILENLEVLNVKSTGLNGEKLFWLKQFPNLKKLHLGGNSITTIEFLQFLEKLEELNLSNTYIKREKLFWLIQFPDLEKLNVSTNNLRSVKELGKLVKLKELDVSNNKLREIEGLGNLINLEKLNLRQNGIWVLTGLEKLVKLKELDGSRNQFEEIGGLGSLINLEKLNLSENYRIRNIDVKKLTNLKVLNLENNNIEEMKGLFSLVNLEKLNLSWNRIWFLTGLEKLKKLKELNLEKNRIESVEYLENISKLTANLKMLNISQNKLRNIKRLGKLKKLELLNLSGNRITSIDIDALKKLTNLRELDLGGNEITSIEALGNLTNLKELDLSHNKITSIETLGNLTNLKELDFGSNEITKIKALQNLTKLESLIFDSNPLTISVENENIIKYFLKQKGKGLQIIYD